MNHIKKLGVFISLFALLNASPAFSAFYLEPEAETAKETQNTSKKQKSRQKIENKTKNIPAQTYEQAAKEQEHPLHYGYPHPYPPYTPQRNYPARQMELKPIIQWQIWKGEKLSDIFSRWAMESGRWKLVWEAPDRIIDNDLVLNCKFEDAVKQVLEVLNADGEYLVAKFYHGNNTIRIQEAD